MSQRPGGRRIVSMSRMVLATLALTAAVLSSFVSSAVAATLHSAPAVETVVVVLSPFLTWHDVTASEAPSLRIAAGQGAVANMNSITGDVGWPTVAGGALTLSASRWTAGPVGTAADPGHLPAIKAANAGSLDPPDIGALGSAIHAGGGRTAAVGNSDEDTSGPAGVRRPAALLAMDRSGKVDLDLTSPGLLEPDPSAPFGVRADPTKMRTAIRIALADKPALLVVDPGDLERAHDAPSQTTEQAARNHADAVRALDGIVFDLRRALGSTHSLLLVVTPATDKPYYQPPYFGPTIATGINLSGELTSASTQRPGLVTNLDVGPTVLSALWMEPATTMVGQPMTTPSGQQGALVGKPSSTGLDSSIGGLDTLGTSVGAVDYLRDLYFIRFFAWGAAIIALVVGVLALVPSPSAGARAGRGLILLALAVPGGAWLMFLLTRYPVTPAGAALAFGVVTVAMFALVLALSRVLRARAEVPLLALSTLTTVVILADQWTGHPFETGLFSYSIRAGWRYYGMGNEGAALLVGASIAAVGLTCDLFAETRWGRPLRVALMPAIAAVALVTAAAPFAGANAGVALWGVIAYGVAWLGVNNVRMGWKAAFGMLAAMVVLLGAFVALDMVRGSGETHLGRFVAEIMSGDFSAVGDLVYRKAANNIGYISQTPYTWLALAMATALAVTRWAGKRPLAVALREHPALAGSLVGVVIGGIAALVTEDSGIVMPSLMLFAGAFPALYLSLADSRKKPLDPDVT
ncbi:MAG TPA: hypothetical protein VIL41_06055 [Coriobacteriia bacterium]